MQMEWLWVKLWGKFHIISQFVHSLIQIKIQILHSSLPHTKIKHTDCSNCSGEPHHCTLLHLSKWMVNPTTAHYSISASGWSTPPLHATPSQQVDGQPHHCMLLHLSKWMVNPTTARYSISASGWSTPPLHATPSQQVDGQPHHCTLLHLSKWMVNPTTARYSISASASESFQCHTSSTQKSRVKYLLLHAQVQCTLTFTHIQLVSLNKSCLQYTDTYIHTYIYIKCTKLTTVFSVAQRRNDLTSRQLEGTLQRLEFTDNDVRLFVYAQTLTTTHQSQLHLLYSIIVP